VRHIRSTGIRPYQNIPGAPVVVVAAADVVVPCGTTVAAAVVVVERNVER
jgi:hypothetical protein